MDQSNTHSISPNLTRARLLGLVVLVLSFALSIHAAVRDGYIGPDYSFHILRIIYGKVFDFAAADPPLYVLFGYRLMRIIGEGKAFVVTQALIQAALNLLALWFFFRRSERDFKSPVLYFAWLAFLAFLPVRLIHSVSVGTDWMTIPVFVLALYFFDRLVSGKGSTTINAGSLGLVLAIGIWSKYSFMALLPAVFIIFLFYWWRGSWNWQRFFTVCALSLVLPTAVTVFSRWEAARMKDSMAQTIWRNGQPADMNFKDLLLVKVNDLQLFKAPEAFTTNIGEAHRHSYLGLSHYGIFTDSMNLFQPIPDNPRYSPHTSPNDKRRPPWKTPIMAASMSLGVIWTLCALIGTAWAMFRALRHLWKAALDREDTAILLGMAFFLLMFLPIPFVHHGAMYGFWTPRLILPCLLCFALAGFLFLDRKVVRGSRLIAYGFLFLIVVQCGLEIVMLV